MDKKHEVKYLPLFYEDLNNIYIAKRLIDEIEKEISSRVYNPESYEKFPSSREDIYYRIYVKNFTIFYVVKDNMMEIRRILYNRKNFNKLI